ncbi:MAG: type I-B CRISPR-associated protein Cas7/Csh2 [Candidatus Altiarchaeales archaeon HGW-Altiarchaeales-3]|nr:MAG: type I-B CRISPR-associated protein Cas7/Csh2 [Candidatus Altiarchaeales archaeon HGW-Altiarchaeales-3]
MSELIKNRSEIVFLYDIKDANPNGDPLDENKPRIDEETGINIVTDVRLKRTIRDYLMNFKGEEIFVKEITNEDGSIQDAKARANNFLEKTDIKDKDFNKQKDEIKKAILEKCIDVRLFGATIPLDISVKKGNKTENITGSITLTGPVQFRMGRSLHKVELKHIKGTGAFAAGKDKRQKTFREEDILPYSLISFYGIINENAAKHSQLSESDISLLLEAIWNGTKNLISRSKVGQMPRLLLKVNYKEENYHLGDLDKLIKIKDIKNIAEEKIRDIGDIELDTSELVEILNSNKEKIDSVDLKIDERVRINLEGLDESIKINSIFFK